LHHNAIEDEPRIKSWPESSLFHDKSVRNPGVAPPRVLWLRDGIFLQPLRPLLVLRRILPPADAVECRRLPVPGLPAENGEANRRKSEPI